MKAAEALRHNPPREGQDALSYIDWMGTIEWPPECRVYLRVFQARERRWRDATG